MSRRLTLLRKGIFVFFSLCVFQVFGQGMEDILSSNIQKLTLSKDKEDLQNIADIFENIAQKNKKEWLPFYYAAYTYIRLGEVSKGSEIDAYCDKAEALLEQAKKIQPNESEIWTLYGYMYSVRIKVNPMLRGMTMGKKSSAYNQQAIEADGQNPRPYLIRAIGMYNTPPLFGGGVKKAIVLVEEALERFENQTPKSSLHPIWGKDTAIWLEKECRKRMER